MLTTSKTLRNKIVYQVFTRNYKDGTFRAVEDDLDRIRSLGVDYIYLLPINPSGEEHRKGSMGSPYAIRDYRAIDPVQGTMEDFVRLSESIHRKGMKLILDIVYNHTSPDSVLFKEHPDWFYHKPDGNVGNRVGDWWDVIDLDYSNKDLWDYQIDTLKMWAEYADGFRCDVAPMVPLEFWAEARSRVSEVKKDFIWIAESVDPRFVRFNRSHGVPMLTDSELYMVFDVCYDFDTYDLMKDVMTNGGSLSEYTGAVDRQEMIFPDNYVKLRYLENHDRARSAMLVPDEVVHRNWIAFDFFAKGMTLLYNGQEFCDTHHPTLFDKDPVNFDTGRDISGFISALAGIKRDSIFGDGTFSVKTVGKDEKIIWAEYNGVIGTENEGRNAVGIFSVTGKKQGIPVWLEDGYYTDLISGRKIDVYEGTMIFDGEPVIIIV